MTAPKPPPRTLQPAEERKVQLFLERAAPIVLENPQLTTERWQILAALATDLDLTSEQFHSTLDDLLNRGVIKRMDVTPPKPPPLPGRRSTLSLPSEDFSLTPPAPPPVQSRPPAPKLQHEDRAPTPSSETWDERDTAPPVIEIRTESARDQFLERARHILAECRGWNAKCQALTLAAAKELGLSESEAREALDSLRVADVFHADATADETNKDKLNSTRWRVEGAPPPIPEPPPKTPADTFLDFARPSLAAVKDAVISEDLELRIIAHGTRVLGLSAVYARDLLLDLIAERKMKLASTGEAPPPIASAENAEEADPRFAEFLHAATPILALHRGLNTQSRVLLNALAHERGLTEQEMERAIASMNPHEPAETLNHSQLERLGVFRPHVESQLKKRARSILTPALYDKLLKAGVELFGIAEETSAATVREIAENLQLAVVTHEQAERHLTELVRDMIGRGTDLTREQRERIELEGAQWGLPAVRTTELITQYRQELEREYRANQRISRLALSSAIGALIIVIAFLAWAVLPRHRNQPATPAESVPSKPTSPKPAVAEKSWIEEHSDLSIAIFNSRSDLPILRKPLTDLTSNDAAYRNSAYEQLVDHFLVQASDELRRRDLAELLSMCLAFEPVEESAEKILTSLLRDVPTLEKPVFDAAAVPRMYWGVRAVAMAIPHAAGQVQRVSQIVTALNRTVGVTVEPSLAAAELEQLCLRSLSERLFGLLISIARSKSASSVPLQVTVTSEAGKYLEQTKLHRLNAQFSSAVLTAEPGRWHDMTDLVQQTIASRDPPAVLDLLQLYEKTADSELRDFLGKTLLTTTSGSPPGTSVDEIATFVRQGLGIRDADDPDGIWTKLARDARGVLTNANAPADPPTPILADTLRLAHYCTLACAFTQNEWGNAAVAELRKNGPKSPEAAPPSASASALEKPPEESAADTSAPLATLDRATVDALRQTLNLLGARRSTPTDRLAAFDSLLRLAERVSELPPEMAATLAAYLLANKSNVEHSRVAGQVGTLAKWNQLVVAVADRVEEAVIPQEQLESLVGNLTSSSTSLPEGKEGRAAARRMLIRFAMQQLSSTTVPTKRPAAGPAENTAALLADAYALQAKLFTVAVPEEVAKSRDPQAILRLLVNDFQSRLAAGKLTPNQQAELARMPHELAATEFLTNNDVQRFVFLERMWLRLLGLETVRRNPDRAAEATKLIQDLQTQDRTANNVLTQLRNGQAALLQMWLLMGKRG